MVSNSQTRIAIALLSAAVLIAGSLLIQSFSKDTYSGEQSDVTVVTAAPERAPIKTFDENNDGVPDWQEALLVTEALKITSTTSEYTQPETLTEQFALEFFENMVRSENYGAFGDSPEQLVRNASDALAKEAVDELLTLKDITVSTDNSQKALALYGELVAAIISTYSQNDGENEAKILERALRNQDELELQKLDTIINIYTQYLEDTKTIAVPSLLQNEHLNLLNSYQALLVDIKAMRVAFTDPMFTLLRLKRYQDDASGLYSSIVNIYEKLIENGVTWPSNSVVYTLIEIDSNENTQ